MFEYTRHEKSIDTLYRNLDRLLEDKSLENKRCVMFGTSNFAAIIIYYLGIHGINVEAIIDNDSKRQGLTVYGVKVYSPKDYLGNKDDNFKIIIASIYQDEMTEQLKKLGYSEEKNIIVAINLKEILSDYSYANREGMKLLSVDEVRKHHLRILKNLDEVCSTHNLRYFICGGTLLGAVRHKGYIPWDDDVDVVMPLKDIKKLSEVMDKNGEFSLVSCFDRTLEHYDVIGYLTDNTTICDCNNIFPQITTGITIDLFPFIGVPDDEAERDGYIRQMRNLDMHKWEVMYDKTLMRRACDKQLEYMMQFDYDDFHTIGNVLGRYFMKDIFPRKWLEETVRLQFENLELNAPKNYEGYLRGLYGDYMQLPPVEKRVGVHNYRAYKKLI